METNKYSIEAVTNELGMSNSIDKRWCTMYKIHEYEVLTMKSRKYSGEFKVHIVKCCRLLKLLGTLTILFSLKRSISQ